MKNRSCVDRGRICSLIFSIGKHFLFYSSFPHVRVNHSVSWHPILQFYNPTTADGGFHAAVREYPDSLVRSMNSRLGPENLIKESLKAVVYAQKYKYNSYLTFSDGCWSNVAVLTYTCLVQRAYISHRPRTNLNLRTSETHIYSVRFVFVDGFKFVYGRIFLAECADYKFEANVIENSLLSPKTVDDYYRWSGTRRTVCATPSVKSWVPTRSLYHLTSIEIARFPNMADELHRDTWFRLLK